MRLPKIRGHFWVERDGEIIDWDFPEHTRLRKKLKCVPEWNAYLRAPPKTEDAMIRLFEKLTLKAFQADNWNNMMPEFIMVAKMTGNGDGPIFDKCWTNVIQEAYYNGGVIRFGSMGYKCKTKVLRTLASPDEVTRLEPFNGTYLWRYGHEDFHHLTDFLG